MELIGDFFLYWGHRIQVLLWLFRLLMIYFCAGSPNPVNMAIRVIYDLFLYWNNRIQLSQVYFIRVARIINFPSILRFVMFVMVISIYIYIYICLRVIRLISDFFWTVIMNLSLILAHLFYFIHMYRYIFIIYLSIYYFFLLFYNLHQ